MVFSALKSVFAKKEKSDFDESVAPRFKTLMKMKHDVAYLKNFGFKKTTRLTGDSKSAFKGRGIEFEEVRAYAFGDDLRDIDWRVTARKNQPFTKIYMEEKDRLVYLWLDLSEKMYFATKGELKSVTASKIAALVGWLALSYQDRFGLALYSGRQTYLFEPQKHQDYFLSILKKIEQVARENINLSETTEDFLKSFQLLQKKAGRQAIMFFVGSFDEASLQKVLPLLKNNEVYVIDIYDPLEATTPPKGDYFAFYNGQKAVLSAGSEKFDTIYQNHFENKRQNLQNLCLKYGAHYRPVQTNLPISAQIKPI